MKLIRKHSVPEDPLDQFNFMARNSLPHRVNCSFPLINEVFRELQPVITEESRHDPHNDSGPLFLDQMQSIPINANESEQFVRSVGIALVQED